MVWDHAHDGHNTRGWLCRPCNLALGAAGENPRILERMADYLRIRGHVTAKPIIS